VVSWCFGRPQLYYKSPICLFHFLAKVLIKAAYRNTKGAIRTIDIYVGGGTVGNKAWAGLIKDGEEQQKVLNRSEYGKQIRFGQRFKVIYLRDVTGRAEENYEQLEVNKKTLSEGKICRVIPNVCISYYAVSEEPELFWRFKVTGIGPQKTTLPVLDGVYLNYPGIFKDQSPSTPINSL